MLKPVEVSKLAIEEKQAHQEPVPLEQQIRDRAYQLYQQRGRSDGHDLEDWLQAKSELTTGVKAA